MRESLKELLQNAPKNTRMFYDQYADYLLANGVIVLPCKVGDTVWELLQEMCEHRDKDVCDVYCDGYDPNCPRYKGGLWAYETKFNYSMLDKIGKTVFLTKEEAEAELRKEGGEE